MRHWVPVVPMAPLPLCPEEDLCLAGGGLGREAGLPGREELVAGHQREAEDGLDSRQHRGDAAERVVGPPDADGAAVQPVAVHGLQRRQGGLRAGELDEAIAPTDGMKEEGKPSVYQPIQCLT